MVELVSDGGLTAFLEPFGFALNMFAVDLYLLGNSLKCLCTLRFSALALKLENVHYQTTLALKRVVTCCPILSPIPNCRLQMALASVIR